MLSNIAEAKYKLADISKRTLEDYGNAGDVDVAVAPQ